MLEVMQRTQRHLAESIYEQGIYLLTNSNLENAVGLLQSSSPLASPQRKYNALVFLHLLSANPSASCLIAFARSVIMGTDTCPCFAASAIPLIVLISQRGHVVTLHLPHSREPGRTHWPSQCTSASPFQNPTLLLKATDTTREVWRKQLVCIPFIPRGVVCSRAILR